VSPDSFFPSFLSFPFFPIMARTIYVEIAVQIDDNACPLETIEDCDYTLDGEGILSHEIIGVHDDDRSYF